MIETAHLPSQTFPQLGSHTKAESRRDPITGDWTIFAPYRDQRPEEFKVTDTVNSSQTTCPFCLGHEAETPDPVWVGQIDAAGSAKTSQQGSDWSVRVVPNKYPAVSPNTDSVTADRDGLFQRQPIGGGHEVIIESPNHIQSLTELDLSDVGLVFKAYQDRIRHWRGVPGIEYISVFKNVGGQAGASLRHSHSQLIAINRRPRLIGNIIERMQHHRATTGCCLQCDLLRAELKTKRRIITQTDALVAYCPFSSRLPMMVRITSKDHHSCFEDLSAESMEAVSRLVVRVVSWLEKLHPRTSYNYLLHTCPPNTVDGNDAFHWSMEIYPRLTQTAGFEWSSQCMINPVLPEFAAQRYRACVSAEDPRVVL